MTERSIRISVGEAIELACAALDSKTEREMKEHFRRYGDWNRVKQLLTEAIYSVKAEGLRNKEKAKKLHGELERIRQEEQFPCYANNFKRKSQSIGESQ